MEKQIFSSRDQVLNFQLVMYACHKPLIQRYFAKIISEKHL